MSRLKRIMKRLAIGFVILFAVLMVVNVMFSWRLGRQLDERLATLRTAGEPTSFAELAPQVIPPEQDAAVHLQRIAPQLKAFAKEQFAFLDRTPLGKSLGEREKLGDPPTREQIDAIREILSHYPDLPQAIDEASRCEGYASLINFAVADSLVMEELMSTMNGRRTPSRFLHWKIIVLLAEGKQDEALKTGLVMLRLARHFDSEPALVHGLVACSVRGAASDSLNLVLRAGPISNDVRQLLDKELAMHEDPTLIQRVMKTERAISLSMVRSQFSQAWWLPWLESGLKVDFLDFYQRLLPVVSQPWHKSRDGVGKLNVGVSYSTPVTGALVTLLEPALESAIVAFHSTTATLRCLQILNGLTAYVQANGREAEGLDDLDLPEAVKLDPFSGKPLRLKWTFEGWVVYSVFLDGVDDGGNFEKQADWGLGPAGYSQ